METMRKVSKEYYIRQIIACYMVCLMTFGIPLQVVMANPAPGNTDIPTPGDLGAGNTAVLDWTGSDLSNPTNPSAVIGTAGGNVVIGWGNFDIGQDASVLFTQDGGWVLNNVQPIDTSATGIWGGLSAPDCGLIVQNPYGVVFGPQSLVQAKSFVATGLLMNIGDFIAQGALFDPLNFEYGGSGGNITLMDGAEIHVNKTLALIGKNIFNKGTIVTKAEDSYVVMTAGDNVVISRENSHVNVNVSSAGPGLNKLENDGVLNTDAAGPAGGKTSLVLAAGDIFSTAIGGVESLRATAVHSAVFDGPINVSAMPGSDAVAEVDISTGDSLTIDHDITADATGDGTFDASASIKLASKGKIEIKCDTSSAPTEVKATAHDGANNSANVEIAAEGNVTIKATKQYVKVEAQADSAAGLNQADVSIKGDNVIIETGHSASTEVVKAYARDADENRANVNIEAKGGVLLNAGSDNQIAIVKAEAKYGSINRAGVGINAGGGVDVIANESDARVIAEASGGCEPAVLNEAKIDIKAGSLTVRSESNNDQAEIRASAWNGTTNTAEVAVETQGDVLVTTEPGESDMAGIEASAHDGVDNLAAVDIKAGGDVEVKDYKKGFESDGDGEAYIKAVATDSENSNTAEVDVEAGGNVVVLAKNGGEAKIEAYAAQSSNSENNANINILAKDGYVLVHAIDGYDNDEFIPSRASIEATAENANGGTNNASINIVARAPVVLDTDSDEDSDGDSDKDGSVLVIGVDGGKAEIEAIAKDGGDNSASVDIDAENDVKVMALCFDQPSQAEITALAKDADNSNTADVTIVAGEDVIVEAKDGGKAEVEAIAKDGDDNAATIGIEAGGDVKVKAYGYASRRGPDIESEATIAAKAEDAGSSNLADIDIVAGKDVVVLSTDGAHAKVDARAAHAYNSENTANIKIAAEDGYVLVHGIGGRYSKRSGFNQSTAKIKATAEYAGDECDSDGVNSANISIIARDVVEQIPADLDDDLDADLDSDKDGSVLVLGVEGGKAEIEAKAMYGGDNSATVDIDAETDVKVMALCHDQPSEAEIMALAKYANNSNTANVTIAAGEDVKVIAKDGGKAEIEAIAKNAYCENTAGIDIKAGDDVKVIAKGRRSDALISALAEGSSEPVKVILVDDDSDGDLDSDIDDDGVVNTATVAIDAGDDVKVLGLGGDAVIEALAYDGTINTAGVAIDAGDDVKVKAAGCEAAIRAEAEAGYGAENSASVALGGVGHKIGGDVEVIAERGNAYIEATASDGFLNNADVLICTEGHLLVQAGELCGEQQCGQKNAYVKAKAYKGYENISSVGIGAEGGIAVLAFDESSNASIASKSMFGYINDSELIACSGSDFWVLGLNGGDAEIASEALYGNINNAYTATVATDDIIVAAADLRRGQQVDQVFSSGFNPGFFSFGGGSSAEIKSEATAFMFSRGETIADAQTHVTSKEGGVAVLAGSINCGGPEAKAGINSKASGAAYNSAYTGVASSGLLTSMDDLAQTTSLGDALSEILNGNVVVAALGNGEAKISSGAYGFRAAESSAMTVICAPGTVVVAGLFGGKARVSSAAFGAEENSAQTKVYAGNVGLIGDGKLKAMTPGNYVSLDHMCITPEGEVAYDDEGDGSALVIIGDYASRTDCPDCPPCPCGDGPPPPPPPAPLYTEAGEPLKPFEFEQGGCPALMQWFANEVGLAEDQIFVMLGNTDYLATDIQPCEACARLKQQADAMAGLDASQLEAWASAVRGGMAGPITPEMIDGIRTALADNPAAMGFDDAAAEYARILNEELGFERDDAVAIVTSNYAPDYADLGAYISARTGM